MKIKMLVTPKGRPEYEQGKVYEFKGAVAETYARKFMEEGWAEPYDDSAAKLAAKTEQEAKDKADAEAAAKIKDEADAKAKLATQSQQGHAPPQQGQQQAKPAS